MSTSEDPELVAWDLLDGPDQESHRVAMWRCERALRQRTSTCEMRATMAVVRVSETHGVVRRVAATATSEGLDEPEAPCEEYRACVESALQGMPGPMPAKFKDVAGFSTGLRAAGAGLGTDPAALREAWLDALKDIEGEIARLEKSSSAADRHNLRGYLALRARFEWALAYAD